MATVVNKETFQVIPSVNTPEYNTSEWLINPDIPEAPKRHWKVSGSSLTLKSASAIATADAEYLSQVKLDKKSALQSQLEDAVGSKYTDGEKMSLLLILQLAIASQNTARITYVSQIAVWIDAGQDILYAGDDLVDAASTVEDVGAIDLDLDSWLSSDPQVVIRTAKGIE